MTSFYPRPTTRRAPDLDSLTGIRSGKPSFYPEYRHSAERLRRVIHALDQISAALVRTVEGSEALVRAVVAAAADHLSARWVMFALVDGALPEAAPRHLVLGRDGVEVTDSGRLPDEIRGHVEQVSHGSFADDHDGDVRRRHAHVPIVLDGEVVGGFAAWTGPDRDIDATDESVLRILAGQTAAALQNCVLYQNLAAARQHQALDEERHRIARELHDSVTQYALSAGMQIELCRGEVTDPGLLMRLDTAKDLARRAVEQLRSAIYALSDDERDDKSLPAMLERLSSVHLPEDLRVEVRIGGHPVPLPAAAEQSLVRIAGEALFNTAVHAQARHAVVRLAYRADRVVLSVSDDGNGRPEEVRRILRAAGSGPSGEHRGLANMQNRARELGGTFAMTRSRLGGLQIQVSVPL
ncbi:GAF domain-containing sensor histidine kinase [Pseudonocardia spinosispora]|uniref:GAF domain-containing sensor histidine kinase n=1 Tax=Pseudonocardia spinosispora TaxID=103441 RepID=UPI000425F8D3|nr:GAF domain-containing sensor histidine kinase [Pseudonocardia spinosispora]